MRYKLSVCVLDVTSPLLITQVLVKKNYTDHIPTPDEEVDGLDFGSEHLAYQQLVGNTTRIYTVRHR